MTFIAQTRHQYTCSHDGWNDLRRRLQICNVVQAMPRYLQKIERLDKLVSVTRKPGGRNAQFCVCASLVWTRLKASVSGRGDKPWPASSCTCCLQNTLCNVPGLATNLSDLTVASSQYDILLCSGTLVSDMRHVSEVLVPSFCRPVVLCRGKMPRARGMAAYVRDFYRAFRQPKFECGCCEMLVFRACG